MSHALVGSLVAAVLFQVLKMGFGSFVASADNYRTVYGAMAAIPIFLLWLYSFWTLLLIGAHIAAALPERHLLGEAGLVDQTTAESCLRAAMQVLRRLWQAAGARETLNLTDLHPEPSPWVLNQLEDAGLIARLDDESLIAGCDFNRAPIGVLWRALDLATPVLEDVNALRVLANIMQSERDFMAKPLSALLQKPDPLAATGPDPGTTKPRQSHQGLAGLKRQDHRGRLLVPDFFGQRQTCNDIQTQLVGWRDAFLLQQVLDLADVLR